MSDAGLNPVDAAVLALIVVATWFGCQTGFVATTYSLASWIFAVAVALASEGPVTTIVETIARLPTPLATTIGFVVTIVIGGRSSPLRATSRSGRSWRCLSRAR